LTESIESRVRAAIASTQNVDPGRVTPETTFEELGMTSLDALALINALEEDFAVAIIPGRRVHPGSRPDPPPGEGARHG